MFFNFVVNGIGGLGIETLKAPRTPRFPAVAQIGDEDIPCAWERRLKGYHYHDPEAKADQDKWKKYVEAIKRDGKVALTRERTDENGKWHRDGYIAVFEVKNVTCDNGLEFDLGNKVAKLK